MPKRFPIKLPKFEQRLNILKIMLESTPLAPGFSFEALADTTKGLSGSDLKETCRNAAMRPARELMREKGGNGAQGMEAAIKEVRAHPRAFRNIPNLWKTDLYILVLTYGVQGFKLRALTNADFVVHDSHAHNYVDPSGSRSVPGRYHIDDDSLQLD